MTYSLLDGIIYIYIYRHRKTSADDGIIIIIIEEARIASTAAAAELYALDILPQCPHTHCEIGHPLCTPRKIDEIYCDIMSCPRCRRRRRAHRIYGQIVQQKKHPRTLQLYCCC